MSDRQRPRASVSDDELDGEPNIMLEAEERRAEGPLITQPQENNPSIPPAIQVSSKRHGLPAAKRGVKVYDKGRSERKDIHYVSIFLLYFSVTS